LGGLWFERWENGEWLEPNEQLLRVLDGETDWDEIPESEALALCADANPRRVRH
jgi:hypothetical protein